MPCKSMKCAENSRQGSNYVGWQCAAGRMVTAAMLPGTTRAIYTWLFTELYCGQSL
jgi:hypothetical protein